MIHKILTSEDLQNRFAEAIEAANMERIKSETAISYAASNDLSIEALLETFAIAISATDKQAGFLQEASRQIRLQDKENFREAEKWKQAKAEEMERNIREDLNKLLEAKGAEKL